MAVLYEPEGDIWIPTDYTRGPWSPDHQHAGPPTALLARALEAASGIEDGQTVRLAADILRPVPMQPLTVTARVVRGGRKVELLEAVLALAADDTELMRARAWRMRAQEVSLPDGLGGAAPPPAPPQDAVAGARPSFLTTDVAYHDGLEWRFLRGEFEQPGPAVCWTRMKVALVPGEPITPLQHLLVAGDAASGVSAELDWTAWTFVNVDFDVALERPPQGDWVVMDAVTRLGDRGAGTCSATYADGTGRVGSSTQALLIAPR